MICLEAIQKQYGDFKLDCSMEVLPGRITALIGANGAGKTTAFKAILGLIRTDGGFIKILDKDIDKLTPKDKQKIGVVLSDSGFSGYLKVRGIIPILKAFYEQFDETLFRSLVQQFELPMDKIIKDFSTGMKAKLKVIVAISHHAKLLILDEPTSGLDVVARDELLELLRNYMAEDEERSILISSHISSDLEQLCDDVYMIDHGRIILHEDTDVLLDEYGILKVSEEQYKALDKQYVLAVKKEPYGYSCLTNQRQFYIENAPEITVEKSAIDTMIMIMIKGEQR